MTVPKEILGLIETFERNIESYKGQEYNEAQLRREFIDPFFETLGWDVTNKQQFAPAYRDVIHEDAIKIGSATKAPDYCFRIGGFRKFFLEAKKPSIDVKGDPHPSYQLRRYAWSAKLPLSILTNFEEFAVYDCQSRPSESDSSSAGRIMFLNYKDYPDNWEKIAGIFSKDSVLKGSFDKFTTSTKTKKGTTTVDIAFLAEIENWRQTFAKTIAHRNLKLTVEQINYAVQKTVDRILFLRMCEDRGIEPYKQLLSFINGDNVYPRICSLFEKADAKYNSGIFHFQKEKDRAEPPDELTLNLSIDDKDLKYIIHSLYYPKCPYEFSVLPPEILGNVYEQFLGKVIRLTEARQVKIDEKPEVKKSGGIYYTPSYIVNYIVKNTIGKLCEGKTPKEIEKLKILDPACGSGSFLLGAYTYLLNYTRDWFVQNNPEKFKKQIYQLKAGQWFLTIEEKKKILLNNIFGVDIDQQAVEVTKLSLLLKTLENETSETIGQTYKMFHERALPDLGNNIKCGNSLIGPDFFENKDPSSIDPNEYKRINPFDWQKEFPEIFSRKNPGFDAVIGNPPYLKEKNNKELFNIIRKSKNKEYCVGKMDLWYVFASVALDLLRSGGFHSFIGTNNWITNYGARLLRDKIMSVTRILKFVDFADYRVFSEASIQTMIYITHKEHIALQYKISYLKISSNFKDENDVIKAINTDSFWVTSTINPARKQEPFTLSNLETSSILEKIKAVKSFHLSSKDIGNGIDVLQDFVGKNHLLKLKDKSIKNGDGVFILSHNEKKSVAITDNDRQKVKPYFTTAEIGRYFALQNNRYWIIYSDKEVRDNIQRYPGIKKHLNKFKSIITSVYGPYGLHRPRDERFFDGPKILSIRKTRKPCFSFVEFPCYVSRSFLVLKPNNYSESIRYLLGLLNSKIVSFWLYHRGKKQGDQLQVDIEPLQNIPIRKIDFENPEDVQKHDKMVSLVESMLDGHKKLQKEKIPDEKVRIQRQIDSTDRQIDKLVFELYNLKKEEIDIVEGKQ